MAINLGKVLVTLGVDSSEFEKGVGRTSQSFMGLSKNVLMGVGAFAGAAAGAVALGKQLYELGGQGAIVQQTQQSFDGLVKKLGLAPDILQQLRDASRGTVDDMTLMSSTATLLAGTSDELGNALGNATPQLLEIAKAANKLNPTLGDTSFLYESIATGIKRASPMILDNLGLTIKIGEANEKYAKSLGVTVDQLSAEDKQMALLNATMDAGNRLIEQAGGNVDSAADSFAQMETQITNAKNQLATAFTPAVTDAIESVLPLIDTVTDWANTEQILNAALDAGLITKSEQIQLHQKFMLGIYDVNDAMEDFGDELANAAEKEAALELATGLMNDQADEAKSKFSELNVVVDATGGFLAGASGAADGVTSSFSGAIGITDNLKESMRTFNEQLVFNKLAANLSEDAAMRLGIALGVIDTRTLVLDSSVAGLTEKYDLNNDEVIDLSEATQGYINDVLGLTGALNNIPAQKDAKVTVTTYYKQVGNPSGFETMPKIPGKGEKPIAFSTGGQFTVPPGYPSDTFPLLVSSGELVTILTPQQQREFSAKANVQQLTSASRQPDDVRVPGLEKWYAYLDRVRAGLWKYGDPIVHEDLSVERPGDKYYDRHIPYGTVPEKKPKPKKPRLPPTIGEPATSDNVQWVEEQPWHYGFGGTVRPNPPMPFDERNDSRFIGTGKSQATGPAGFIPSYAPGQWQPTINSNTINNNNFINVSRTLVYATNPAVTAYVLNNARQQEFDEITGAI